MDFEKKIGFVIDGHNDIEVVGYEGNKILIHTHPSPLLRKMGLKENSNGIFFNINQVRYYLVKK